MLIILLFILQVRAESESEIKAWRHKMLNRPSATKDTPLATPEQMELIYTELNKIRKLEEYAYPWQWLHGKKPGEIQDYLSYPLKK